jgi:SAM-dependent methyltransferase
MDAHTWDERYRSTELVWGVEPNQFVRAEVEGLTSGAALDLACGEGRNAVWLATLCWEVTGVDFSQVALDKAARLAEANHVTGTWERADLAGWSPHQEFDLVLVCYLQVPDPPRSAIMSAAARAVAPGGTLLVIAHDFSNLTDGVGGPQDPAVLYTADDVRRDLLASEVDMAIERAERVRRPVRTDSGSADAFDCLVRAHRVHATPTKETPT